MSTRPRRAFTLFQLLIVLAIAGHRLRAVPAGPGQGAGGGGARPVAEQPQADRPRLPQLLRRQQGLPAPAATPRTSRPPSTSCRSSSRTTSTRASTSTSRWTTRPTPRPARAVIKTFLNPTDPVQTVNDDYGSTNYLFNAGSKPDLADNDGVFYLDSKITFADITDGTSNTLFTGETLKGDGGTKADGRAAAVRPLEEGRSQGDQGRRRRAGLQGRQEHRRRPLRQLDGRPLPPGHVHRHAAA